MNQHSFFIWLGIEQMGQGMYYVDPHSTIENLFQQLAILPLPYQEFDLIRQDQSSLKLLDKKSPITILNQGEVIKMISLQQKIQPQDVLLIQHLNSLQLQQDNEFKPLKYNEIPQNIEQSQYVQKPYFSPQNSYMPNLYYANLPQQFVQQNQNMQSYQQFMLPQKRAYQPQINKPTQFQGQQTINQIDDVEQKNQEINDLKSQILDLQFELQGNKVKLTNANFKVTSLELELENANNSLLKYKKNFNEQLQKQKENYEQYLNIAEQKLKSLQNYQNLRELKMVKEFCQGQEEFFQDYQNQMEDLRIQNNKLENQLKDLKTLSILNQYSDEQDQRVSALEEENKILQYSIEKEHQNFMNELEKSKNLNINIQNIQQKLLVSESSLENIYKLYMQTQNFQQQQQNIVKQLEQKLQYQYDQNKQQKVIIQDLIKNLEKQEKTYVQCNVGSSISIAEMDEENEKQDQEREMVYEDYMRFQKYQQGQKQQELESNIKKTQ